VLLADVPQVVLKRLAQGFRQHGYAILLPLALSDNDFTTAKVEVLES
jgi:hypothetical protein